MTFTCPLGLKNDKFNNYPANFINMYGIFIGSMDDSSSTWSHLCVECMCGIFASTCCNNNKDSCSVKSFLDGADLNARNLDSFVNFQM